MEGELYLDDSSTSLTLKVIKASKAFKTKHGVPARLVLVNDDQYTKEEVRAVTATETRAVPETRAVHNVLRNHLFVVGAI